MNIELISLEVRARIHAALGEPARLAIADMLLLGEASPSEIGQALSLPTNLVAHHLRVLAECGLIERTPSEGDRRRTYVRLNADVLDRVDPPRIRAVKRVLFVCSHNSARSQLATALWAKHSEIPTTSAGTMPAPRVHPRAVRVARRHGLSLGQARTANVTDVLRPDDFIIAVCDNAHERLPASARPTLHWSVPDPAPANTDAAFEAAYADIAARITRLSPLLTLEEPSCVGRHSR